MRFLLLFSAIFLVSMVPGQKSHNVQFCNPVAIAGPDQEVDGEITVLLDGSSSFANCGRSIVIYSWTKVVGPSATINHANQAITSVTLTGIGTWTFKLTVRDNAQGESTDFVSVTNQP